MNPFREILYSGLGFAAHSGEAARRAVSRFTNRGAGTAERGKEVVDRVRHEAVESQHRMESIVRHEVARTLERLGVARRSEVDGLRAKVSELEREIRRLETGVQESRRESGGEGKGGTR